MQRVAVPSRISSASEASSIKRTFTAPTYLRGRSRGPHGSVISITGTSTGARSVKGRDTSRGREFVAFAAVELAAGALLSDALHHATRRFVVRPLAAAAKESTVARHEPSV